MDVTIRDGTGEHFGWAGHCYTMSRELVLVVERLSVEQRLRELDRLGEDLCEIEQALAQATIGDERLRRLLTITGVNTTVAIVLQSAIGAIARFPNPHKLVGYFGLNPAGYQSGLAPARHGHMPKRGRCYARAMLVEAAWVPRRRLARCAPSSCARVTAAASRSPLWLRSPSWPSSCGMCSREVNRSRGAVPL